MGNSNTYKGLSEDVLQDYEDLTYLSKGEILYLMKKFHSLGPEALEADFHHRFHCRHVVTKFPMLQNNPFQDRLFRVFSSRQDDCFSFEDMLDLCSAMSANCPPEVKAAWAFRLYDLDEDNQIGKEDISGIVDRLSSGPASSPGGPGSSPGDPGSGPGAGVLDPHTRTHIASTLLEEMKLQSIGSIGLKEFQIAMSRLPEFSHAFYFRL